jgi:putative membrane-bound dehydrogenase-like protein
MRLTCLASLLFVGCALAAVRMGLWADEPVLTGPATEKRFPALKVPPGFKATLFACDPLIEYPSVIAAGPRPGAIFVAIDYMTGLGLDHVRQDEIRLVEDTDGDGYADRATVFARGFNSIQGLAYHDGTLYVMHAPYLTALRDSKGTGTADERKDLLTGLGLTPKQNPVLLHCANGVVPGHDGWLYLALGDNGVNVLRPEGDRLILQGGGILRCRPDGRDLHVFSSGLRNIYDIALDAELNVFVRDNENDGGTYMIRVCHSYHGADHGYPYLYDQRPDEALAPLADLGLGSSAGGACYLEGQFPPEYRGNLFFCEWGRSVVRYQPQRAGSGFGPLKEEVFAAGQSNDPYGFKPTDLVVQRDGTMMVSDWADGQRPKRGRGRIYHIAHAGQPPMPAGNKPARLDAESYYERCAAQAAVERLGEAGRKAMASTLTTDRLAPRGKMHAIWAFARLAGPAGVDDLLHIAGTDRAPQVRAQAVRAVADLVDPVLTRHKLDAGPGDSRMAERIAKLGSDEDARVRLEVVIALGRMRWAGAPEWLRQHLKNPDAPLAHAAMQTLRRSENWSAILDLMDRPGGEPVREIAARTAAERYQPALVDGIIDRLAREKDAGRRRQYADLLTRVCKKPGPWVYWGYRPGPRPANSVAWERTEAITQALNGMLADPDRGVRLAVLRRMQREKIETRLGPLRSWLQGESQAEPVAAILDSLAEQPRTEVQPMLDVVIRDEKHTAANRRAALALALRTNAEPLLALGEALEDGPVLADVLRRLGSQPKLAGAPLLVRKLKSGDGAVRAAAMESLGELGAEAGRAAVAMLLQDRDVRVRRAAAVAAGSFGVKETAETLLKLLTDPEADVRRASLDSLRRLQERRAVPLAVAALTDRALELKALEYLHEFGEPEQAAAVADFARKSPSADVTTAAVRALTAWRERKGLPAAVGEQLDRRVAEVQAGSGILPGWRVSGPWPASETAALVKRFGERAPPGEPGWQMAFATGAESRLQLPVKDAAKEELWLAYTEVDVSQPTAVEFLASSRGSLQVWLNGRSLHRRDQPRTFQIDSDRFSDTLAAGTNRLLVQTASVKAGAEFHLRFRRKSAKAQHERLIQAALTRGGNVEAGRRLFFDTDKSLCLKCHRLGEQGERVGPELTGVGGRFSRIYLVESILEPSRTIAPSFGTLVVGLKNGKTVSGVKVDESATSLTLADNQGQKHVIPRADIEELSASAISVMPEGLEQRFTEEEFINLIAFLGSQKNDRGR